jgi:hypothetical protein
VEIEYSMQRPQHKGKNKSKMYLREVGCKNVNWDELHYGGV